MLIKSFITFAILTLANTEYYTGFSPAYYSNHFKSNNSNQSDCVPHDEDIKDANSLFEGCQLKNDTKVYSMFIDKAGRFYERTKTIEYPGELPAGHVRNEIVTAVNCYQLTVNVKGSCKIERGGIGQNFVKLRLASGDRYLRLYYKVEIFTRNV